MNGIFLINTPVRTAIDASFFPVGLAYVASAVERTGRPMRVLDLNLRRPPEDGEELALRVVLDDSFRYVGISGMASQSGVVRRYAHLVKELRPDCTVIVGGRMTAVPNLALDIPDIDYCVIGDGEETILELADALDAGADPLALGIPGIAGRVDGVVRVSPPRPFVRDLEMLEPLKYELFDVERYIENQQRTGSHRGAGGRRSLNMIASRGCPFRCTFCGEDSGSLRKRSVSSTLDEIERLIAAYRIEHIHFSDGLFVNSRRRMHEFCDEYDRRGLAISWSGNARADIVSRSLLERMKASGCNHLGYGFESGSPKMLKAMNKTTTVEQNGNVIRLHRELELGLSSSFILGAKGETLSTMLSTAVFALRHHFNPSAVNFMMVYPGTADWQHCVQTGVISDPKAYADFIGNAGDGKDYSQSRLFANMTAMNNRTFFIGGKVAQRMIRTGNRLWRAWSYYKTRGLVATGRRVAKHVAGTAD